jgi:hypothetical protein
MDRFQLQLTILDEWLRDNHQEKSINNIIFTDLAFECDENGKEYVTGWFDIIYEGNEIKSCIATRETSGDYSLNYLFDFPIESITLK